MNLLRTVLVVSLLKEPTSSEQLFTNAICDVARVTNVKAMTDAMDLARMDSHSTCIDGVQQALQSWSSASEYIPYFSPLTVSMLIGPAFMHVRLACYSNGSTSSRRTLNSQGRMLEPILAEFAQYWEIGDIIFREYCLRCPSTLFG